MPLTLSSPASSVPRYDELHAHLRIGERGQWRLLAIGTRGGLSSESVFKSLHELKERHIEGETKIPQLHQIKAALAHLAFADKGLRTAQLLSQIVLRETGSFAGGAQEREHQVVFGTMNGSADGCHPKGRLKRQGLKSITDLRTL